jgi:hypothetical protein
MSKRPSTAVMADAPEALQDVVATAAPDTPETVVDADKIGFSGQLYAVFAINDHFLLGSHAVPGDLPEGHEAFMRLMTDEEVAVAGATITQH